MDSTKPHEMKVFVNGHLFDSEKEPIALVFDDDAQRRLVGSQISNMADRDDNKPRVYASFPDPQPEGFFETLCGNIDVAVAAAKSGSACAAATGGCPNFNRTGEKCAHCQ